MKGWSIVTPSTLGYTPEIDPWPFNPDKAGQLLAEAGYPGGQGFGKLIVNTTPGATMPLQVEQRNWPPSSGERSWGWMWR